MLLFVSDRTRAWAARRRVVQKMGARLARRDPACADCVNLSAAITRAQFA
jgi:hypothetical protein